MVETVSKEEFLLDANRFAVKISKGAVFIHPTDTIYGIGCDATNKDAVNKVREAKGRNEKPFSVIAPSKKWILDNCYVGDNAEEWIDRLPGPYTLILKLKNRKCIANETNMGMETLGIRMPEHWISNFVSDIGKPIITTSANTTGGDFMTSLDDLDTEISKRMDFIIYEGEKKGRPSKIVDLTSHEKITER